MNAKHLLLAVLLATSLVGGAVSVASASNHETPADLRIEQPEYVSTTVGTTQNANTTIYTVKGNNFDIYTETINRSAVASVSVDAENAQLEYRPQGDFYDFSPRKTDGSYKITWVVQETEQTQVVRNNTTVTQSRQVTNDYTAVIQVSESNVTHVPQDEYNQVEQKADNWDEVVGTIESIYGADANVQSALDSAEAYWKFLANPFAYFSGGVIATILTLTTTAGGLLVLAFLIGLMLVTAGGAIIGYNRYRTLSGAEAEIDEKVDYVILKQMKQSMVAVDIDDVFSNPWVAERWRKDLDADNLWDAFTVVIALFDSSRIVRQKLQAMDAAGYSASVSRGDDGSIKDVEFDEEGELGKSPWGLADEEEVVDHLVNNSPEEFDDFAMKNVDLSEYPDISLDVRSELDGVLDQLEDNVARREADKKQRAREINEILQNVREHEYTDDDGNPSAIRTVFEMMLRIQNEAGDRHGFPNVSRLQDYNYFLLNNYDRDSPILNGGDDE